MIIKYVYCICNVLSLINLMFYCNPKPNQQPPDHTFPKLIKTNINMFHWFIVMFLYKSATNINLREDYYHPHSYHQYDPQVSQNYL